MDGNHAGLVDQGIPGMALESNEHELKSQWGISCIPKSRVTYIALNLIIPQIWQFQ